MAQSGYTPILIYASGTASAVPSSANMTSSASGAELALNYLDGKLYYKNSAGTVTLLASTAGASGDVVGPASATDNALARFDLTTGKLIQNSVGILSDAGILTGLTGITSSGSITLSSLTSGRVTYAGTGGLLQDSANLTFSGSALAVTGTISASGAISSTGTGTANGVRVGGTTVTTALYDDGSGTVYLDATLGSNTNIPLTIRTKGSGDLLIQPGGSTVGTFSSTGLAVTGTLGVSSTFFKPEGTFVQWNSTGAAGGTNRGIVWADSSSNLYIGSGSGNSTVGTFNSTGLGIGTAPAYKLDVRVTGTGNVANFQSDSGPNIRFTGTETSGRTFQIGEGLVTAGSFSIYDTTGSAERLVVSSGGSVGIGEANPGTYSKLVVRNDTASGAGSGGASTIWLLNANTTANNASTIFFGDNASAAAGAINFVNTNHTLDYGQISFDTNGASGYGTRVTINSVGNVGINVTSPASNLDIFPVFSGSTGTTLGDIAYADINARSGGYLNQYGQICFGYTGNYATAAIGFLPTLASGNTKGDLVFATRDVTTDTAPTERVRITSAGYVGIGTSSPTNYLDVSGTVGKRYTSNVTVPNNNTSTAVLNVFNGQNFSNWLAANMNTGGPCTGIISITWDTGGSASSAIFSFAKHSGFDGVSVELQSSANYNGDTTTSGGIISIRNNGGASLTPVFSVLLTTQ